MEGLCFMCYHTSQLLPPRPIYLHSNNYFEQPCDLAFAHSCGCSQIPCDRPWLHRDVALVSDILRLQQLTQPHLRSTSPMLSRLMAQSPSQYTCGNVLRTPKAATTQPPVPKAVIRLADAETSSRAQRYPRCLVK
jgi:hypothetical protein